MQLKVGSRLRSAAGTAEVIVIRAPKDDVALTCGGYAMVPQDSSEPPVADAPKPDAPGTVLVGKRYVDDDLGIEVLVTKAGEGCLAVDGVALKLREAKALPASD